VVFGLGFPARPAFFLLAAPAFAVPAAPLAAPFAPLAAAPFVFSWAAVLGLLQWCQFQSQVFVSIWIILRDAVSEALCHSGGGNALSADNDLDLRPVSKVTNNRLFKSGTYLHRTVVDLDAVQFVCGLSGTSCLDEDDGGSATAATSRPVGEHDLLDRSYGFAEVVLNKFRVSPILSGVASSPFAEIDVA
jgi:hypothetical protein